MWIKRPSTPNIMQKFIYHIQRWTGRKNESKRVEILATCGIEAGKQIELKYPGWEISMFWQEYITIKKQILWTPWGNREYTF